MVRVSRVATRFTSPPEVFEDKPAWNIDKIPCDTDDPLVMPVEHLEARICELAGHITAATCRYLVLVADFDARGAWASWEMPSCAAWLAWKAARLSYAKVPPAAARRIRRRHRRHSPGLPRQRPGAARWLLGRDKERFRAV